MAEEQGEDMLARIRAEQAEQKRLMEEARKKFDTTADAGDEEYEYFYGEAVNPWKEIWFRPAHTMRHILDNEPWYTVFLIAIMAGIARVLVNSFLVPTTDEAFEFIPMLFLSIFAGGVAGIVGLYFWAYMVQWIGTVMGGKGTAQEVMQALTWSKLPDVIPLVYALFLVLFVMQEEFFQMVSDEDVEGIFIALEDPLLIVYLLLTGVSFLWGLFLKVRCLAEAQQYTSVQAFFNIIIAWGVVVGLLGWMLRFITLPLMVLAPPFISDFLLGRFLDYLFMML